STRLWPSWPPSATPWPSWASSDSDPPPGEAVSTPPPRRVVVASPPDGETMTSIVGTPVPERAPSPPVAGAARPCRPLARATPLALAVVAGALVALVSAHLIWPRGTTNLDEVVYLNQAEALRHGEV